uniref:tetratricopeptide repeat protein n=1 Tax=Nitrospira cf. moscoviensis SBR1015 TaxID=96242 RepID=UPI00111D46FE|nr:tetratricopeptide repeat protein [Nitrospira cf. moscoviensis SBR1015]
MRTDKKTTQKTDKKSGRSGFKQSAVGYGKKTVLLEEAITQMNMGRYGRSSAALKELLALDPHNMEARRLFATLHLRVGSLILARQAFDSLIDEAFVRQDYWLAESLLREYLAAGPRCVPYLEKLGSILQDKGEVLEAVIEYGKAVDILIEDPDPEHPDRASQLYEKIKELAPGSPVDVRLAGCVDPQTGKFAVRPPAEVAPDAPSMDEDGAAPSTSESIAESTLWGRTDNSSVDQASANSAYLQGAPEDVSAGLPREEQGFVDAPLPHDPSMNGHGSIDFDPRSVSSQSEDPALLATEPVQAWDSQPLDIQQETAPQSVPTPMPWDEVQETTVSIPDQLIAELPGELSSGLAPDAAPSQPEDATAFTMEPVQVLDSQPLETQQESVPQSVPAPMPWEEVQETTVSIPDQLVAESPDTLPSPLEPAQSPLSRVAGPNGGELSWDSVFQNTLKLGAASPVVPPPLYRQEVDPGTIEIQEATRTTSPLSVAAAPSEAAPMPWDQVQESAIAIPHQQMEESVVESPVEPAPAVHPEPVYAQDPPLSVLSTVDGASGVDALSITESLPAPFLSEAAHVPANVSSAVAPTEYQAAGEAVDEQPFTFGFAGEPRKSLEQGASDPQWASEENPLPAADVAPLNLQSENVAISPTGDSVEPGLASQGGMSGSHVEPIPKTAGSWAILDEMPDRQAEHEEPNPVLAEEKAPFEPVPGPKEWIKTSESIRFAGESPTSPMLEAEPNAPVWGEPSTIYSAQGAAGVLSESPDLHRQTDTRERTAQSKPRPKLPSRLTRLGSALSSFIRSCFSTTRAIVMSLIALVVLSCTLVVLGIGALGLVWAIMEEPPSSAFSNLTTSPQRRVSDINKNGYLLLLGFDAPRGQDPIQAGYERKPDLHDADKALACLGGASDGSPTGQSDVSAKALSGWFKGPDPAGRFKLHRDSIGKLAGQTGPMLSRYGQWHKLSFEDWGYGQGISPPCAEINFAHRLYVAEGFAQGADTGIDRLEMDLEAWRIALGQARTLPVKTLALQAMNDDITVASGILVSPDFDGKYLGRLAKMLRPLDRDELSVRWPMQSELVHAAKSFDAQLKVAKEKKQTVPAAVASFLPLPKQRRLNDYADYYEASSKASAEGQYGALPRWSNYISFPADSVKDYFVNPVENVIGLEPLAPWDLYNGLVVDVEAHLRLASLQAWIRRGPQDAELLPRIAKAGQKFYDPYTGFPMLVNLKKHVLYSVGHDGKDQDGDSQSDVVVAIPVN